MDTIYIQQRNIIAFIQISSFILSYFSEDNTSSYNNYFYMCRTDLLVNRLHVGIKNQSAYFNEEFDSWLPYIEMLSLVFYISNRLRRLPAKR